VIHLKILIKWRNLIQVEDFRYLSIVWKILKAFNSIDAELSIFS
jgi:hypothetical protein